MVVSRERKKLTFCPAEFSFPFYFAPKYIPFCLVILFENEFKSKNFKNCS